MQYSEPTLEDEGIRINLNTSPVAKPESFAGATKVPEGTTNAGNANLNDILSGLGQTTGSVSPTTSLVSAESTTAEELTTTDNVETSALSTSPTESTTTDSAKTTSEIKSSAIPEEKKEDQSGRLSVEGEDERNFE